MLARGLARRGWRVAFVSHPISPLHIAEWQESGCRDRVAIYRSGGLEDCRGNVWTYVPFTLIPPHKYPITRSPWIIKNWYRWTFPSIREKVKRAGFGNVDLLYFDNPAQNFWLNSIKHARSVYRMPDNAAEFGKAAATVSVAERELCGSVDYVLCTAKNLLTRAENLGARSARYFPNGVELGHFQTGQCEEPARYRDIPSPRIIYVGEMAERFDFQLVRFLAQTFKAFSFVLIGRCQRARKEFEGHQNVYPMGCIPYAELPPYIRHANVGIIPFDVKRKNGLINGVNPLKLYQYLSSGIPVVSVEWPELAEMDVPATLCAGETEFAEALVTALENGVDQRIVHKFLAGKGWDERVYDLEHLIDLEGADASGAWGRKQN